MRRDETDDRRRSLLALLAVLLCVCSAAAASVRDLAAADAVEIGAGELAQVFPGADSAGAFAGRPPAAPVFRGGDLVGYVFSTLAVVDSVGYSGKPLDVLAGIDLDGRITGALLRRHSEPILVIGVSDEDLARFVHGFSGLDLKLRVSEKLPPEVGRGLPDAIAGATVSSGVIRDSIIRAGRTVGRARGLLGAARGEGARLDRETFEPATWRELLADGSIVEQRLSSAGEGAGPTAAPPRPTIELFAALATPPRVGQNLLGKQTFNRLVSAIGPDEQLLFVAANGLYSFKGTGWVRTGRFDRVQVVQGEKTIPLTSRGYENIERLAVADAPELREAGIFVLPAESGFDPLRPWRLDLLLPPEMAAPPVLSVEYRLPDRYRLAPAAAGEEDDALAWPGETAGQPLWLSAWRERWGSVLAVGALLAALSVMLVLQDAVAARKVLHRRLRLAFLAVTLFGLGWIIGGQLSVVNVLTFAHALMGEFRWEFFLVDPVLFLLWSYVAIALLFWGRGVFCGWLCPFGALQELLNEAARRLRVRQVRLPFLLHERLWPLKYVLFIGLFAVSLNSINLAFAGAEVEPFKTAISLKFVRPWPFVLYAVALLLAGLLIERFFCRYLCPLGAGLAIPARIRMFEWLKRHPQCGRECRICEHSCPVQAIHPSGAINPNECIYCLKCQTLYYDDTTCPPLVARRKRRERREALAAGQNVVMPKEKE